MSFMSTSISKKTIFASILGGGLLSYVVAKRWGFFGSEDSNGEDSEDDIILPPKPFKSPSLLPLNSKPSILSDSTAIVFLGSRGSGRSTAIRLMRPWLRKWSYSSRHLTIANVVGKGYVEGSYSEAEWSKTYKVYTDRMKEEKLYYVKRLLRCVEERDSHPTVMMVSNIHDEEEIVYLESKVGKVIVIALEREGKVSDTPWFTFGRPETRTRVMNDGTEKTFESNLRMAFVGHVLPCMRSYMTLGEIKDSILSTTIVKDGSPYYDTFALWSHPHSLSSVMYAYASLLKLKELDVDCVVAVSEKAVPLTSFLSHMLSCRNILLLHHTSIHEDLNPFEVTWRQGQSAVGNFAIGWPNHLTKEGERVLLIDDILATGHKATQVIELARERKTNVVAFGVLFQIGNTASLPKDVAVLRLIDFR